MKNIKNGSMGKLFWVCLMVMTVTHHATAYNTGTNNYNYNSDNYSNDFNQYATEFNSYATGGGYPAQNNANFPYNTSYQNNPYNDNGQATDMLGTLIQRQTNDYRYNTNLLYSARSDARYSVYNEVNSWDDGIYQGFDDSGYDENALPNFDGWLNEGYNRQSVNGYRRYLVNQVGKDRVPPMSQLLVSARDWRDCNAEAYAVPPRNLWSTMLPTLELLAELKRQGIIPKDTIIRSVYRNPTLNKCAGGAKASQHRVNGAIDLWSDSAIRYPSLMSQTKEKLCNFWRYQGEDYEFGLGLYSKGAIHIDTYRHRKWGGVCAGL